jgi:hypothetical protein
MLHGILFQVVGMYAVVHFVEEGSVAAVPKTWTEEREGVCLYICYHQYCTIALTK